MSLYAFAASLLLILAPQAVTADQDPLGELARMTDAVTRLNYEGTFVYAHAGQLQTMRVVHQADADGEREHLVSLDGDPREVVRDRDDVVCILADGKPVRLDHYQARGAFPGRGLGELSDLEQLYGVAYGPTSRVAGRTVRMLEIQPRDQLRYGYRFWLDQATALPLKSEVLAADGEVLERVMFTDIQLHAVADPDRVAAIRARKAQVQAMVGDAPPTPDARSRRWQVNDLPPGFALADYRTYPDAGDGIDHLVFSDGLAMVSVYVEPANATQPLNGTHRSGAVSTFALVRDAHQVVVVGDVPMATAHIIGVAVNPSQAAH
jgi:sigma-E factor negative regulatory protein RseB